MTPRAWQLALLCAGAAACAVGPDFQQPATPGVGRYTHDDVRGTIIADGVAQEVRPGAPLVSQWWQLFHSRALDGLVTQALTGNASLEAARASMRRSRYSLLAGYGVFWPQLDLNAGATRERFTAAQFGMTTPPSEFNVYTLGGTLGYTLDVFGGNRRTVEGLRAQVDVQCYSLAAARLSVTGNVVNTAIAGAAYRAEIAATEQLITSLRQQVSIAEAQATAGTAAYSSVLQLRSQLASTIATLPPLRVRLVQAENLLASLIGRAPAEWRPPELELAQITLPGDLPVSLPSELARQRPDILVAEANLHVASANVGVATAAMFPRFSISGASGVSSNRLGSLFSSTSVFWNLGVNLTQPLFHGGTLWYQRKAAIEAFNQSFASYRQTVINALSDVANSLSALALDAELVDAQDKAAHTAADARKLIETNYAAGLVDYVQVLIAENTYLQAKLGYIQAQAQRLQDTVALFIALGGGWWPDRPALCGT
jgi:NodT family efflux transporter outer membrane factor (OMF) lipoprotein